MYKWIYIYLQNAYFDNVEIMLCSLNALEDIVRSYGVRSVDEGREEGKHVRSGLMATGITEDDDGTLTQYPHLRVYVMRYFPADFSS